MDSNKLNKVKNIKLSNKKNLLLYQKFKDLSRYIQHLISNTPDEKEKRKQGFRLRYINLAVSIIKNHPHKIKSSDDLKEYSGIGKGIQARVDEIIKTGTLPELKTDIYEQIKERMTIIEQLSGVHGIGPKMAKQFVDKFKVKNVTELKKKIKSGEIEVGDKLKIALKHHNKFKTNIPRAEIDIVNEMISKIIKKLDPDLVFTIAGSYRRGAMKSNDIDVLFSHKKYTTKNKYHKSNVNLLSKLVSELKKQKFLIDDLTDDTKEKYMGFSKLRGKPVRRFDLIFIPYNSFPAALLYFTGSYQLNTIMRNKAKQMNMRLNQNGLYEYKDNKLKLIKTTSEKAIFKRLKMKYLEPENRNIT